MIDLSTDIVMFNWHRSKRFIDSISLCKIYRSKTSRRNSKKPFVRELLIAIHFFLLNLFFFSFPFRLCQHNLWPLEPREFSRDFFRAMIFLLAFFPAWMKMSVERRRSKSNARLLHKRYQCVFRCWYFCVFIFPDVGEFSFNYIKDV